MAEEKENEAAEEAKGGSNKLLIIIIAVLALALIGVGVMMFLGGGDEASPEASEEAVPEVKAQPVYYTFNAPFITNFSEQSAGQVSYMQIKMKVMARSQAVVDAIELHLPAIQHELNLLFMSQKYDDLQTIEGNQALKQASTDTINQILKDNEVEGELEAVYFTSFIMQ